MTTQTIQSTVTKEFVCGFADDHLTGRGRKSLPIWTHDRAQALPATAENVMKVEAARHSFVLAA
jgi:hypothetical protein